MPYQPTNPYPHNVAINLDKEMQFSFKVDAYDVVEGFKIELYDYLKQKKLYTIIRTTGKVKEIQDEEGNSVFVLQEGNKQILEILNYDGTQLLLKEMDWEEELEGNSILPVSGGDNLVSIVKLNLHRYIADLKKYEQKIYYKDTDDALELTITNEECFEIDENGVIVTYYEEKNLNENGELIPTVLIPYKLYFEGEEKEVTGIADRVFENCQVERVVFPTTLLTIGNEAFLNCISLHTIDFNTGNTIVGDWAFAGCINLINVNFVDSIKDIGIYAFTNCNSLTYIELPTSENFEIIKEGVFGYTNLSSIILSNSIKEISSKAFIECHNLFFINFNSNLKVIGDEAFLNCDSLQKVEINEGVVSIGYRAFEGCSALEEISFPTSLDVINIENGNNQGVLNGCVNLEKITIPFIGKNSMDNESESSVLGALFGIDDYHLEGMDTITQYYSNDNSLTYNIPPYLETIILTNCSIIPYGCFYNCGTLVTIELPDTLTVINDYGFYNCVRLSGIDIPANVEYIGNYAFALKEQKNLKVEGSE